MIDRGCPLVLPWTPQEVAPQIFEQSATLICSMCVEEFHLSLKCIHSPIGLDLIFV
jgi:hypothetical protein